MNMSELRSEPVQKRTAVWALVVLFVLGVTAIGVVSRADRDDGLPRLPIGAAGATAAMERSGAADAMLAPWGGIEYRLGGDLPDLPRSATAHRIEAASRDDVVRLAAALGLSGAVRETAEEFVVVDGRKELHVQRLYGSPWWFNDMAAQDQATVSANGADGSSSSGVACGCPEGAECDCPAPDVVPCEMPPCPDGSSCAQVCPEPSPRMPERPADLPSQDEAREIAREVLTELGVDAGELRVDDGFTSWYVNAPTAVDGMTVEGLMTSVAVGPKGVVMSANGLAGRIVAVGDYPLVTSAEGFERLKSGFPHSGVDCIDCTRPLPADATAAEPAADPDAPVSSDDAARCAADGPGCMEPAPPSAGMCAEGSGPECNDTPMPCETVSSVPPDEAALKEAEARRAAEAETEAQSGGGSTGSAGAATQIAAEPGCARPEPYPMPAPEPQIVTITGAHLGLLAFGEYLVPAFVFESGNGSFPVIAVEQEHLAAVTPDPGVQGRPEPAIEDRVIFDEQENGTLVVD